MTEDRKYWTPLECNPEVFNSWAENAGLDLSAAWFQDVYGLDDELLDMVLQPVKAVIVLFPDSKEFADERKAEDLRLADGTRWHAKVNPTIFWMKQTVGNACGTMALIHALANTKLTHAPGSPMSKFLQQCEANSPDKWGRILETTFSNIHAESAASGQSITPTDPTLEPEGHFTCFVEAPEVELVGAAVGTSEEDASKTDGSTAMHLVELNGSRGGPIDRGVCDNLLQATVKHVKVKYISQTPSMYFSMLALVAPKQQQPTS